MDNVTETFEIDNVLAISGRDWPQRADRWPARQRPSGWPSKQLIQAVFADGCHVVPTSHPKSSNPDVEWRYSFSVAERTLAQSLTDSQLQCYILMKTIVMHELNHSNVLTSYHLKTVFFWQCEKIPASEWSKDTGLAVNLLWLLDELVYCVATHCLPHYFTPENNLFHHINPDFLSDVARTISSIRRDPLRHVLAFNKRFRFPFSLVSCDLAYILSDIIDDTTMIYDYQQHARFLKQLFALILLGKQHMREKRYDEATCVFTRLTQIERRPGHSDATLCYNMSFACSELEAAQALGVLEYLVTTFPDDQDVHSLLGNVACMYHSAAFAAGNEDKRQEMLQKAEENFDKTMECGEGNAAANQINYSMFLLHLHRYVEAVIVLKQVIFRDSHNPKTTNRFLASERNTIEDENLINEIKWHGYVITYSVAFAYYLLAKIYCESCRQRQAEKLLPDFQRFCNDIVVEEVINSEFFNSRAYSLLGYSYLALQLADGYTLAEQMCVLSYVFIYGT